MQVFTRNNKLLLGLCSLAAMTALGILAHAMPIQQYVPAQQPQLTPVQPAEQYVPPQQFTHPQTTYSQTTYPQTNVAKGFEAAPAIPVSQIPVTQAPFNQASFEQAPLSQSPPAYTDSHPIQSATYVAVPQNTQSEFVEFANTNYAPLQPSAPVQIPALPTSPTASQQLPTRPAIAVTPLADQPSLPFVAKPSLPAAGGGDFALKQKVPSLSASFAKSPKEPLEPLAPAAPLEPAAQTPDQLSSWQPPLTATPGHNERVNMSPDLSLSPPAQPGKAVNEYLPVQAPAFQPRDYPANFDRQVGYRGAEPTRRFDVYPLDDGEKFDFETKKRDFPPFGEIIATGRFFYMGEVLWAEPQFQGSTLIATESPGFGQSIPDDFDSDFHPRVRFGFESPYGPGIEFTYFNINSNSEIASFTSNGTVIGQTNAWVIGRNIWSRIFANDPGEHLAAQHSIDIDSGTVSFFKELKFPISRVNGNFGFQYVSIAQELNANVTSADGTTVETLRSATDMRAYGPRAILEYYRPIGHTPLELVTTFGGSVLFGQRDQFVTNSQTGLENRLGADEFLTILDFLVAVQYTKTVGENRSWYGRFGFMNQTWIGGGTAAFPQGDFGLRGLTFGIGYNR